MTERAPRLFVGGPRDGKVLQVPVGAEAWDASAPTPDGGIGSTLYRREFIAVGDDVFEIYLHGEPPDPNEVALLLGRAHLMPVGRMELTR